MIPKIMFLCFFHAYRNLFFFSYIFFPFLSLHNLSFFTFQNLLSSKKNFNQIMVFRTKSQFDTPNKFESFCCVLCVLFFLVSGFSEKIATAVKYEQNNENLSLQNIENTQFSKSYGEYMKFVEIFIKTGMMIICKMVEDLKSIFARFKLSKILFKLKNSMKKFVSY